MIPGASEITVSPFNAAAFGAAVVCGVLLLQYAHLRKRFILLWASGWLLITPSMLLVAHAYGTPMLDRAAVGLSQFLRVCTALLFFWSGDVFRQTGYVQPSRLRVLVPVAMWFVLAPLAFGTGAVLAPGQVIAAVLLAAAGAMYAAVVLERRMIGAGLVAFVLFGLAVSNLTTAYLVQAGGGQVLYEMVLVNAVLHTFGALGINLLVFEEMTFDLRLTNRQLETAQEELVQAAITDALTGCHNRRFLEQVMSRELQRHARFELPLSLLFVDVDRFKAINDTLGHDAGDRVLVYVARFLERRIREADYVFRWGGDEFLVLITCSGAEARRKAAALKAAFDTEPDIADLPPGVGLSIGTVEVPAGTTDLTPLLNEADRRMYVDKGVSVSSGPRRSRRARASAKS